MQELNLVEKVIALEGAELLKGLTPDQLMQIAYVATQIHFPPNRTILQPDKPLDAMYIILDGSVGLWSSGQMLDTARQGDVLGSWALFDEAPLPVTARTLEDTILLQISREDFFDLLSDNMDIASRLFSTLVKRFRAVLEKAAAP